MKRLRIPLLALVVSSLTAGLCAVFGHGLELILQWQRKYPVVLFLLPAVLWLTLKVERFLSSDSLSTQSLPPLRFLLRKQTLSELLLVPLCWLSHLAGASVGRESVAVHAGQAVARYFSDLVDLKSWPDWNQRFLRVGVVSGFAAMFGTPLTAVIFAYEWQAQSSREWLKHKALLSRFDLLELFLLVCCAAWAFQLSEDAFAVEHLNFQAGIPFFDAHFIYFLFGLFAATLIFARLYERVKTAVTTLVSRLTAQEMTRVAFAAALLSAVLFFSSAGRYAGLGVDLMHSAFNQKSDLELLPWDPLGKAFFTAVSLALGFKGGEVTPLLAVGSALGSVLGSVFGVIPHVAAAAGFAALFATVFSVPLAGIVLSFEMFGFHAGLPSALICLFIFVFNYFRHKYAAFKVSR